LFSNIILGVTKMPKGQKNNKTELAFPKVKKSAAQEAINALKLDAEDKELFEKVLKKKWLLIEKVPVRLKLTAEEKKQFDCYVSLAIDEGKANKNIKVAEGEVVTYAVKKLLKGDSFLHEQMKAGYKVKTSKDRENEKKAKK